MLRFEGDVRLSLGIAAQRACELLLQPPAPEMLMVDLRTAELLDSTTLGVLARTAERFSTTQGRQALLLGPSEDLQRLLRSMGLTALFRIEPALALPDDGDLAPIAAAELDDDALRHAVIDAHRALMNLSEENKAEFTELVETLTRLDRDDS